jgi:hypothetical protein
MAKLFVTGDIGRTPQRDCDRGCTDSIEIVDAMNRWRLTEAVGKIFSELQKTEINH